MNQIGVCHSLLEAVSICLKPCVLFRLWSCSFFWRKARLSHFHWCSTLCFSVSYLEIWGVETSLAVDLGDWQCRELNAPTTTDIRKSDSRIARISFLLASTVFKTRLKTAVATDRKVKCSQNAIFLSYFSSSLLNLFCRLSCCVSHPDFIWYFHNLNTFLVSECVHVSWS